MKTVFLHIGTHKTGSTSLQRLLSRNGSQMRRDGILYPLAGRPEVDTEARYGHHRLAWSIQGKRGINDLNDWKRVVEEIESDVRRKVVLSSEVFATCNANQLTRIMSFLRGMDVHVIVYIRHPIDFMKSAYKQFVKRGKYSRPFSSFITDYAYLCDYGGLLRTWEDGFGVGRVTILLFDKHKMVANGLEKSFLNVLGVSADAYALCDGTHANLSPSDAKVAVVRWINYLDNIMPSGARSIIHRARRQVLRGTTVGRAIEFSAARFISTRIAREDDVRRLKYLLADSHRTFVSTYVKLQDQSFLKL